MNIEWLNALLYVESKEDLEKAINLVPEVLVEELKKILNVCASITKEVKVAPLYYASMKYYDDICFRIYGNNEILAKGGEYTSEGISSLGFAFYTDNLLKNLEGWDRWVQKQT